MGVKSYLDQEWNAMQRPANNPCSTLLVELVGNDQNIRIDF